MSERRIILNGNTEIGKDGMTAGINTAIAAENLPTYFEGI